MTVFPLPLGELLGHWPSYLVYMAIGFGFGYVLEISGFGQSTKLAAQFYFRELTVLKVMFTAILVAMVLVFLATGLGLLDYNLVWVNPTYLYPGIVGGLIMGVGFILGGFCPGTSLVSAATGKIDGLFFVGGVFFGIFLFGESVGFYEGFWHSSYMGRFTLMDLFNVSTGVVVLAVVVVALLAFVAAEYAEQAVGKLDLAQFGRWRYGAAGVLVLAAVGVLLVGQPTNAQRWARMPAQQARLADRAVYAHPGEVLHLMDDPRLAVYLIDVRPETDYNLFHLLDAHHIPLADVAAAAAELQFEPPNTLFVVMSNDEAAATEAWQTLVAASVPNVYILEGGVNHWLLLYGGDAFATTQRVASVQDDALAYPFTAALGSRYPAADPNAHMFAYDYEAVVQLQVKRGPGGGGCG